MKKLLVFGLGLFAIAFTACKQNKAQSDIAGMTQNDSLQNIISQKDSEINDMMGIMNEIQEGFQKINEAENRVSIVKDGEGANKAQQIRENIQFIAKTMKKNRELIAKLQDQLGKSSLKGTQLKATIDNLLKQLDEKDQQLQQMRAELDAKDIHISELDETINNLNTNVSNLTTESTQKSQTISAQDKQLHTAWYVFGTKSARLLTMHPSSSYTLTRDASKQYVLTITNPDLFWSTSKYLVIQVK